MPKQQRVLFREEAKAMWRQKRSVEFIHKCIVNLQNNLSGLRKKFRKIPFFTFTFSWQSNMVSALLDITRELRSRYMHALHFMHLERNRRSE